MRSESSVGWESADDAWRMEKSDCRRGAGRADTVPESRSGAWWEDSAEERTRAPAYASSARSARVGMGWEGVHRFQAREAARRRLSCLARTESSRSRGRTTKTPLSCHLDESRVDDEESDSASLACRLASRCASEACVGGVEEGGRGVVIGGGIFRVESSEMLVDGGGREVVVVEGDFVERVWEVDLNDVNVNLNDDVVEGWVADGITDEVTDEVTDGVVDGVVDGVGGVERAERGSAQPRRSDSSNSALICDFIPSLSLLTLTLTQPNTNNQRQECIHCHSS